MEIKKIKTFIAIILLAIFGLLIIEAGTMVHEGFHNVILRLMGCKAGSSAEVFTGATGFECELSDLQMQVVALAGPIGAFLTGLAIWKFLGEDKPIRLLALFLMVYSAIPSLFLGISNSDASVAVEHGFNEGVMWLLFIIVLGVSVICFLEEIMEKPIEKIIGL